MSIIRQEIKNHLQAISSLLLKEDNVSLLNKELEIITTNVNKKYNKV